MKDPSDSTPIGRLRNLGPASARMLEPIGITIRADLERVGPVLAYRALKDIHPDVSLNLLWAMHGSRDGTLWLGTATAGLQKLRRKDRFVDRTHFLGTTLRYSADTLLVAAQDSSGARLLNSFTPGQEAPVHSTTQDSRMWSYLSGRDGTEWVGFGFSISREGALYQRVADSVSFVPALSRPEMERLGPVRALYEDATGGLPHDANHVGFDYVGLHYKDPEQNQYAYILEGFDADWIEAGTRREATYTNVPPGDYVFRVRAANSDGVWNEEGASVRLTVLPPWWRTWWAYALYGLVFAAGVFAVDRYQRRRLIAREREKARERELEQEKAYAREIERAHTELTAAHDHLKATQQQLVHSEKMASLGQLTAGLAHEIKNPLNFVTNFAEVNEELAQELREALAQGEPLDDIIADLEQNATVIKQHGQRADGIVRSMMAHARAGKGEREAVDLNALVDEHVELAYHGKRSQLPGFFGGWVSCTRPRLR